MPSGGTYSAGIQGSRPAFMIWEAERRVQEEETKMELQMTSLYRSVMDSRFNPLKNLPPARRFQAMLFLSFMWTTAFCAALGAWLWYGSLMILHLVLVMAVVLTGWTFRAADRQVMTYRDHPLRDGTARYDDVWGA